MANQLKTVTHERDQAISNAKIEMTQTKAEHVNDISKMHNLRNQEVTAAMSKIEKLERNTGEMRNELKSS